MVWIVISIIWILIFITAFFGDYSEKELREDYKKYEEIINGGLEGHRRLWGTV